MHQTWINKTSTYVSNDGKLNNNKITTSAAKVTENVLEIY